MSNNLKTQAMKRLLTIGLVLSSVFALTNCSEQLVTPEKEQINVDGNIENNTPQEGLASIPYEVYVNEPETKTIASGGKTYWVDEATALANGLGKDAVDRVTIYTMGADSKYTCHGKYTYAGNKKFVGDLYGESGEINNWYCLYPYNSSVAATGKSGIEETFIFGASAAENYTQIQYGENNMNHIAGKNYPMWGTTPENNKNNPTFTMSHLSSLVEIKLVNETGNPISINQVELISAKKPIVGQFKVAITEGDPTFTASGTNSNTALLKFGDNGSNVTIAAGTPEKPTESRFFLAVAPVKDKYTIRINGTAITHSTEIALASGKRNVLKITIPKLHADQQFKTSKSDGTEFITWDMGKTKNSLATINGTKDISIKTITDGDILIEGTLGAFLGDSKTTSALPISFYAASKVERTSDGNYVKLPAELDVASVRLYAHIVIEFIVKLFDKVVDISFDGEDLSRKLGGMRVGFELSPIGSFNDDLSNLIILDEAANYYYIDEEKANVLLEGADIYVDSNSNGKADENEYFKVQDFRNAIFEGTKESWLKIYSLVEKLAPGQFAENNEAQEDTALVKLLDLLIADTTVDEVRALAGGYIQDAVITIVLKTSGEAVCWGLKVQSTDGDLPKAN